MVSLALEEVARALGGEISGGQVRAPGPGHSAADRSLSVHLDPGAPDGFVVHSFANNDPMECKDFVREKLGRPAWEPRATGEQRVERLSAKAPRPYSDAGLIREGYSQAATYDYRAADGALLYQVVRYEHPEQPKTFRQRRPDGRGGWLADAGARKVLYRYADLARVAHTTVWITEGEKDADRLAGLGFVAMTAASGKWTPEMGASLTDCEVFILEDNDEPGRKKAEAAAAVVRPYASAVKIVRLPGLKPRGDVSDWLDAGNDHARLPEIASGSEGGKRGLTAAELQSMSFAPVKYVVNGYVPEGLTILAGKPKLGKSWLVLDICNAVAKGGFTLGDTKCVEGDVLYCALEDNPRRLKARMAAVCPLTPWPKRLTFWTDMPRLDDGGIDALREWIGAQRDPRLIVIDTLSFVRPGKRRDEDSYNHDQRSIRPIKDLADEFGLAIIVVHHTRKMGADDQLEVVSGTNGLTGAADTILVLDRGSEGCTLYGRGRDIEEVETAIQFQRDICRWRVLGDAGEVRRSEQRSEILAALKQEGGPMSPREVADVTGQPGNNLRQLLLKMARAGEVEKAGRGKYRLPDHTPSNNDNNDNNRRRTG